MIQVTLNGEKTEIPEKLSLQDFVAHFRFPGERIAIEHNREIVKRKDWASVEVRSGDTIEIVHFVGGG
jgi:sulfur carrier protein